MNFVLHFDECILNLKLIFFSSRYYLCDFARSMPPEAPTEAGGKMAHLVHLLRPELVQNFSRPLCRYMISIFFKKKIKSKIKEKSI